MKPILEIRNISKSYQIGAKRERYLSLRDSLVSFRKKGWQKKEDFWALQDVSFDVYPGDTLGIIGRNGAGKSTLLKILSRITPPTKGSITVRGRLASLLEVGTGFHPELTGRENIFLNGSILGLKRREILRQFDEIVDFSGVEQFLDTPLKHYSSGMQLRLAFAVAAHLEPEVLLIDEVLAVGDAEFQKKCLGKMDEVSRSGRTVLFVSHNLGAMRQLCKNGLLLHKSKMKFYGNLNMAINKYEDEDVGTNNPCWTNQIEKPNRVFLEKIEIWNMANKVITNRFFMGEPITIHFHIKGIRETKQFVVGFDLLRANMVILRSRQVDTNGIDIIHPGDHHIFTCEIPAWFLHQGTYNIRPFIAIHFVERLTKAFCKIELPIYISMDPSRSPYHNILNKNNQPGVIFPTFNWTCKKV